MAGKTALPLSPIERLIRKGGADRVSASAIKTLEGILEEIAFEISTHAREIAEHAGRKTVIAEDIKLAYKNLK